MTNQTKMKQDQRKWSSIDCTQAHLVQALTRKTTAMSQSPAIAATVRTCESPSNFLELVKVRYKKYCDTCFRYSVAMVLARVGLHLLPSPWLTVKACNSRRANLLAVITNLLAKKKRPLLDQISDAPAPDAIRAYRRCIENSWVHNTEDRWTITELRDQLAAARLLLPAAIRTESPSSGSLGGKLPAPSTTPDATAMDAADGPTASDSDGSRAAPLGSSEGFFLLKLPMAQLLRVLADRAAPPLLLCWAHLRAFFRRIMPTAQLLRVLSDRSRPPLLLWASLRALFRRTLPMAQLLRVLMDCAWPPRMLWAPLKVLFLLVLALRRWLVSSPILP